VAKLLGAKNVNPSDPLAIESPASHRRLWAILLGILDVLFVPLIIVGAKKVSRRS
jgi:hypothetical protein